MTIYIASMNMRGNWATKPDNTSTINVTSAQATKSLNRRDFSPMTPIPNGYKGYWNFESYWQSGKIYEGIPEEKTKAWWKVQVKPKRRYPNSKGKKVLHASWDGYENKQMGYVESRKKVYVPEYYKLIKNRYMSMYWCGYAKTHDIVVFDFDGPRLPNGTPICLEVTPDLLKEKILNTEHPFGHGYIIAGMLAGITPDMYI